MKIAVTNVVFQISGSSPNCIINLNNIANEREICEARFLKKIGGRQSVSANDLLLSFFYTVPDKMRVQNKTKSNFLCSLLNDGRNYSVGVYAIIFRANSCEIIVEKHGFGSVIYY